MSETKTTHGTIHEDQPKPAEYVVNIWDHADVDGEGFVGYTVNPVGHAHKHIALFPKGIPESKGRAYALRDLLNTLSANQATDVLAAVTKERDELVDFLRLMDSGKCPWPEGEKQCTGPGHYGRNCAECSVIWVVNNIPAVEKALEGGK